MAAGCLVAAMDIAVARLMIELIRAIMFRHKAGALGWRRGLLVECTYSSSSLPGGLIDRILTVRPGACVHGCC